MKRETEFGTVEFGGTYSPDLLNACEAVPDLPFGTPYIWNSIVRSAIIWAQLNPHATIGQRVLLLQDVARSLGIDASCIG
ncbi:hypothetical protein FKW31_03050 [Acetobacter sp. DmW_136]|uniref:hypothetical protein n=1 Tax=Acetobacter sp. DmW_136 TaxID=2591091 RepID=UPI00123BE66E|nr:hypothetical protein [Acetobacter sp. DmW_136]KAA8387638.1 hypothetical protein FKW31_03050 [Acetobacter sp. DmW_136]